MTRPACSTCTLECTNVAIVTSPPVPGNRSAAASYAGRFVAAARHAQATALRVMRGLLQLRAPYGDTVTVTFS